MRFNWAVVRLTAIDHDEMTELVLMLRPLRLDPTN